MTEWTYHRAYPYGREHTRRQHVTLSRTPASARDRLRRPLDVRPVDEWPHCSEGMVKLPSADGARQPAALSTMIAGTFREQELPSASGWKARAATPLWQPRTQTPRVRVEGFVTRGGGDVPQWMEPCGEPIKQSRAALATQRRAAMERAKPSPLDASGCSSSPRLERAPHRALYTAFMARRPDAARRFVREGMPAYYEALNALDRADAQRNLERETALVNATHTYLVRSGLSPKRRFRQSAGRAPAPQRAALAPPPEDDVVPFNLREQMLTVLSDE